MPTLVPDVVVMDVEMRSMDGISVTVALSTIAPRSVVVVLTLYDGAATQARASAARARAFVGKHIAAQTLAAAIRFAAGSTAA